MRGIRFIDTLFQDLRFGVRMSLKSKGFTTVAALSLALGIGANTAIFSLLDALLLKPLPVRRPEQFVLQHTSARMWPKYFLQQIRIFGADRKFIRTSPTCRQNQYVKSVS